MDLFAQSGVVTALMLGALAVVIGWLLLRTHRYLSRQRRSDWPLVRVGRLPRREQGHRLDAPPEMVRGEAQMYETARELSAQLDSKMGALQTLIAEAERAAARLEAAAARLPNATRQSAPPDPQPTTQAEALRASPPLDQATSEAEEVSPRPSARRRREEIYSLADYGLDAAEIARRVGSPVGEVELILSLRERD
jgi:cell division septation protein DedD